LTPDEQQRLAPFWQMRDVGRKPDDLLFETIDREHLDGQAVGHYFELARSRIKLSRAWRIGSSGVVRRIRSPASAFGGMT